LFGFADQREPGHLGLRSDRTEAKLDTARSKRVNDLANVVADYAEARRLRVCLNYATQGRLSVVRHGVGLVEHDHLKGRNIAAAGVLSQLFLGELFHLVADDLDSTLIRGVQLEHALSVEVLTEHVFR